MKTSTAMNDLTRLLDKLRHPKVLVLGDLILDGYTWGNADHVSPEAPVLVLKADQHEVRLGGAASVANLLQALEAEVSVSGVVGDDAEGRVILKLLDDAGINRAGVFCDSSRPTTDKERFIGRAAQRHPHQILRVDHELCSPLPSPVEQQLSDFLLPMLPTFDVILISDYAKGVCTPPLLTRVIAAAKQLTLPVLVDPARTADYSRYRDATLLCPNRVEAEMASDITIHSPADAIEAGKRIFEKFYVKTVIVKLDRDGMVLVQAGGPGRHFPTKERHVYDVTGAGDMVLAMLGLARASGLYWAEAAQLANVAAGLEVERMGVVPVTRTEIEREIGTKPKRVSLAEMTTLADRYRTEGKRLVFTNGCMDLLHLGHVTYLLEAAEMGDVLVVAINSDASVRRLKGDGRPVMAQEQRATLVSALECVDHVLILDDDTPHELLREIRPDVLVKGGTTGEIVGREVVESYGGQVQHLSTVPGVSTTEILQSLAQPNGLAMS